MTVTEAETDLIKTYEEVYPAVASFVAKMGGTQEDAKDLLHDAFVIFFERGAAENPGAYIFGIVKHLWVRKYKHDKYRVDLDDKIEIPQEEEPSPIVARLLRLVETAGRSCLDLLQAFYYEKRSAESIADEFNYSNAHSATVQKHKCLQKVRSFVKTKSLDYESFIE
ncbi:MAG TPA: sigma-70 family RNA polymerase sigma factor [Cyclobacteriaceae bacterium]